MTIHNKTLGSSSITFQELGDTTYMHSCQYGLVSCLGYPSCRLFFLYCKSSYIMACADPYLISKCVETVDNIISRSFLPIHKLLIESCYFHVLIEPTSYNGFDQLTLPQPKESHYRALSHNGCKIQLQNSYIYLTFTFNHVRAKALHRSFLNFPSATVNVVYCDGF